MDNEQLNKDIETLRTLINWNKLSLGGSDDEFCYALGAREAVKRLAAYVDGQCKVGG